MDGRSKRKKPREYLTCERCLGGFEVIVGNPRNRQWCSLACAYEGIKDRTKAGSSNVPCLQCGVIRLVPRERLQRGRGLFCNWSCFTKYQQKLGAEKRLERICGQCGIVFQVMPGSFGHSHVWKYCSQVCYKAKRADEARKKDGQEYMNTHGYVEVNAYDHPYAKNAGKFTRRVMKHRLVMETMLGRFLLPHETVHHRNGDPLCNEPSNLELWKKKHPVGTRVEDIYQKDLHRLMQENLALKQEVAKLRSIPEVSYQLEA